MKRLLKIIKILNIFDFELNEIENRFFVCYITTLKMIDE